MPPTGVWRSSILLLGILVAGFASDIFTLTLGSALIWGAILGVWLAVLSRFYAWPNIVGPIYGWAWTVALIVFLIQLIL